MKSAPKRDALWINAGQEAKGIEILPKGYPVNTWGREIKYSYIIQREAKIKGCAFFDVRFLTNIKAFAKSMVKSPSTRHRSKYARKGKSFWKNKLEVRKDKSKLDK